MPVSSITQKPTARTPLRKAPRRYRAFVAPLGRSINESFSQVFSPEPERTRSVTAQEVALAIELIHVRELAFALASQDAKRCRKVLALAKETAGALGGVK